MRGSMSVRFFSNEQANELLAKGYQEGKQYGKRRSNIRATRLSVSIVVCACRTLLQDMPGVGWTISRQQREKGHSGKPEAQKKRKASRNGTRDIK